MNTSLDFALVPDCSFRPIFYDLPPELKANLEKILPQTYERIDGALKLAWFVMGDERILHASEPRILRIRQSFLRAALTEFASAEDVLKREVKIKYSEKSPLLFRDCAHPHIRVVRELRNLEVHLQSSPLNPSQIQCLLQLGERSGSTQDTIWLLEPLTIANFQSLKNAKYYSKAEIEQLVNWFNQAQSVWGITHVFFLAVKTYSELLEDRYYGGERHDQHNTSP